MQVQMKTHELFRGALLASSVALGMSVSGPAAQAATLFYDNFQDGNLDGWSPQSTGGAATFDVVSERAHIRHVSGTETGDQSSLSITFEYQAAHIVSFDMEALAFLSQYTYRTRHGLAGVEVSFLNTFNVPLGSAGLFNVTSTSLLGPNDYQIGSTLQSYSATMSEFAGLADLDSTDPIAKMTLSFLARGSYSFGGNIYPNVRSGGDVWFDNVKVTTDTQPIVPIPAAIYLLSSVMLGLMGIGRIQKAS